MINPSTALAVGITLWIILVDVMLALGKFPTFSQRIRYHGRRWWFRLFVALNMINLYLHWFHKDIWFW